MPRNLEVNSGCVRGKSTEPLTYRNKGVCGDGAGQSRLRQRRAVLGQKTELGILGKGMCKARSRN